MHGRFRHDDDDDDDGYDDDNVRQDGKSRPPRCQREKESAASRATTLGARLLRARCGLISESSVAMPVARISNGAPAGTDGSVTNVIYSACEESRGILNRGAIRVVVDCGAFYGVII